MKSFFAKEGRAFHIISTSSSNVKMWSYNIHIRPTASACIICDKVSFGLFEGFQSLVSLPLMYRVRFASWIPSSSSCNTLSIVANVTGSGSISLLTILSFHPVSYKIAERRRGGGEVGGIRVVLSNLCQDEGYSSEVLYGLSRKP